MSTGRWHAPIGVPSRGRRTTRLIAIGAARYAAGKSVVALNLAASMAALGRQVVLVDLDPRTPRQHRMIGLTPPTETLNAWFEHRRHRADAAPATTRIRNLRIVPAVAPATDAGARRALVEELYELDCDVVVVDLGNSNRDDLFESFATYALRAIVTDVDARSLDATYAYLEEAARRARARNGKKAAAVLQRFRGGLIANRATSPEERETAHAFSRLVLDKLGIPIPVLASLETSPRVAESLRACQPLVARRGLDANVRAFHQMAELVLNENGLGAMTSSECALDAVEARAAVAAVSTAAGGSPSEVATAIGAYVRKHPRVPVDWAATLQLPNGAIAVRVRDVSESGAALETLLKLRPGDEGVLCFDQLAGHPALEVQVSNVVPAQTRVGVRFIGAASGPANGPDGADVAEIAASITRIARSRLPG
jgi:MinD-like ATPase involved in chromosome partitioning or flagellar assembly